MKIVATTVIISAAFFGVANAADRLDKIKEALEERDYSVLRVVDPAVKGTVIEACRDGRQFQLTVDRDGDVIQRDRQGWCKNANASKRAERRRFSDRDFEGTKALRGQDCQDMLAYLTEETEVLFRSESAELSPDAEPMLRKIARVTNRCKKAKLEIAGHTDSDGSRAENQLLSERRAKAVAEYLVREGVSLERLEVLGYGQDRPRSEQKRLNRRIELVLDWKA